MGNLYIFKNLFSKVLLLAFGASLISCSTDDFVEEPYRSDSDFVGVWEFEKATLYSANGDMIIDRSTCGQGNEIDRLATDFIFYPDETAEAIPICPNVQRLDFDRFIQTENSITLYYNDRTEIVTYGIDSITESRIIIYKDGKWIHLRKTEDL
ncbi:hypothetical protein OO013_14700 [Mangrovivirga sp. M17]|uniref:META domain-containing protein n=1 Tax=Mangrovivirga halotolerans TaxID=2993936 RepID=A0ABT3RTK6_9BACT|nr:hypothetical protein [Mangrovivirga halotolerans]MCX2745127.1 hypothetical protein [Mangrovivirga halotolerans]